VEGRPIQIVGTYFSKDLRNGTESFTTGVRVTNPWWNVQGRWPADNSKEVLAGERLAAELNIHPGDTIRASDQPLLVTGIVTTGAAEDDEIVAPLEVAQTLLGRPGAVQRVYVSAVTKPEDTLATRDPRGMDSATYDRWYCSPYATSIAYQLQQAIPRSRSEQIRQIAQNEGVVLSRIQGLMLLITLASLAAAALAVSAAMANSIFERRSEVGLMKALGARSGLVATLFFSEAALLALIAGSVGYGLGSLLARQVGVWIFNSAVPVQPVLLPIVLFLAALVTFAGSASAIRKAMRFDPVLALRGDA